MFQERDLELGALQGLRSALDDHNISLAQTDDGVTLLTGDLDGLQVSLKATDAHAAALSGGLGSLGASILSVISRLRQQAASLGAAYAPGPDMLGEHEPGSAAARNAARNATLLATRRPADNRIPDLSAVGTINYNSPRWRNLSPEEKARLEGMTRRERIDRYVPFTGSEREREQVDRYHAGIASAVRDLDRTQDYRDDALKVDDITARGVSGLI